MAGDTGKGNRFVTCVHVFKELLCINGDHIPCILAKDLVYSIENKCPRICFYSILKTIYEAVSQETYYKLAGVDWDEFQHILSKRSREYASFKTWMISRLKNVDGVTRKRLLRIYLELSSYTHPSIKLYGRREPSSSLIYKAMDSILYMKFLSCREISNKLCSIDAGNLVECRFEKTYKQYLKFCSKNNS